MSIYFLRAVVFFRRPERGLVVRSTSSLNRLHTLCTVITGLLRRIAIREHDTLNCHRVIVWFHECKELCDLRAISACNNRFKSTSLYRLHSTNVTQDQWTDETVCIYCNNKNNPLVILGQYMLNTKNFITYNQCLFYLWKTASWKLNDLYLNFQCHPMSNVIWWTERPYMTYYMRFIQTLIIRCTVYDIPVESYVTFILAL